MFFFTKIPIFKTDFVFLYVKTLLFYTRITFDFNNEFKKCQLVFFVYFLINARSHSSQSAFSFLNTGSPSKNAMFLVNLSTKIASMHYIFQSQLPNEIKEVLVWENFFVICSYHFTTLVVSCSDIFISFRWTSFVFVGIPHPYSKKLSITTKVCL